jgi:hypothetical protein
VFQNDSTESKAADIIASSAAASHFRWTQFNSSHRYRSSPFAIVLSVTVHCYITSALYTDIK